MWSVAVLAASCTSTSIFTTASTSSQYGRVQWNACLSLHWSSTTVLNLLRKSASSLASGPVSFDQRHALTAVARAAAGRALIASRADWVAGDGSFATATPETSAIP